MASILPPKRPCAPTNGPAPDLRARTFGSDMRQLDQPQPMSRLINWALTDLMLEHGEIVLMGEDVGRKGGVYGVTQKLCDRFGPDQFLAYLHNAEDQLRGEAATLPFFSNGQFSNPMVLRIAGLGYQRGFGGHFHNDNSLAVLRDIPGVILACPSNGADAARMLRGCVRLAREEQRVVVFVEPIALYPMRDLHTEKDGGWMHTYPAPDQSIALGEVGVTGDGPLAILTYGNGHYLSQQAEPLLAAQGIETRIIDIRWLAPLPTEGILSALEGAQKVLVVDESRRSGNVSEALITMLSAASPLPRARLTAEDSFIATGPAYAATMPSRDSIVAAASALWTQS